MQFLLPWPKAIGQEIKKCVQEKAKVENLPVNKYICTQIIDEDVSIF